MLSVLLCLYAYIIDDNFIDWQNSRTHKKINYLSNFNPSCLLKIDQLSLHSIIPTAELIHSSIIGNASPPAPSPLSHHSHTRGSLHPHTGPVKWTSAPIKPDPWPLRATPQRKWENSNFRSDLSSSYLWWWCTNKYCERRCHKRSSEVALRRRNWSHFLG